MIGNKTTDQVRDVLSELADGDFSKAAEKLLSSLGYRGDDALPSETVTVGDFIVDHPAENPDTKSEQEFSENTQSVRFISQISDAEITANAQQALIDSSAFDTGNARSFLFLAVELNEATYSRGQYAAFTREINKRWQIPTVVLFKTAANLLTLAFAHRRLHRRDPGRDVLGNVFLIREIDPVKPHRAHLDILDDLSLPKRLGWMSAHGKPLNFDGLLEAWLDALDTEELNRRFYRGLFKWFEHAVAQAKFPQTGPKVLKPEEHVIRLIARLLFVWFIKEKGLVAEDLFVENQVGALLQDYDRTGGDSYYRAVLQNLFFATLNTEIGERRFSKQTSDDHRNFSVYRYRNEIAEPDALLDLFAQTPFINGGLFDCLDDFDGVKAGGVRIDCFTDNAGQRSDYSIPNTLFFDEDSQDPGLITLFNHYKFTVEENTPAEREVALDPELLGKVFENLLAANIPETSETVRKQTGSYYTPRPVVDYMVNEALVGALAQKTQGDDGDGESWQVKLRDLLDYDDAFSDVDDLFSPCEKAAVVRAIANTRTLDPAVGSGAFPMSILHHLTLALRRLDPDNQLWAELQKERALEESGTAYEAATQQERDERLAEISETFERYRDSDFGRKLYLIQNSIFGVDIQVVATQIAKLRFFISLAIEQQAVTTADNLGIKPLPNLETRFVAADSLIGLSRPAQLSLGQTDSVKRLQVELDNNREQHFHANTRRRKLEYRKQDTGLREQLAAALRETGFAAGDADKVAQWDPYDQNASAAWFDPEYMFGVADGFDVVIGNPPYVSHDKISSQVKPTLGSAYESYKPFADLYCYFIERAAKLQKDGGVSALITSNSFLKAEYGALIRNYLRRNTVLLQVLNIENSQVFDNVIVNVAITITRKAAPDHDDLCLVASGGLSSNDSYDLIDAKSFKVSQSYFDRSSWNLVEPGIHDIQKKIESVGKTLAQLGTKIRLGIATGSNKAFVINEQQKEAFHKASRGNRDIIKPILRGRDIQRYNYTLPGLYVLLTKNGVDVERDYPDVYKYLDSFGDSFRNRGAQGKHWTNLRACSFFDDFKKEKIVWIELNDTGRFALCNDEVYLLNSAYFLLPPKGVNSKFLLGVLNSSTIRFYLDQIAGTSGMGTNRWINNYVKEFPIPSATSNQQEPIIGLVDDILKAKDADANADTSEIEEEIDWLAYDLYGLTNAEVAVVEGEKGEVHATVEDEDAALSEAMDEVLGEECASRDELIAILQEPDEG